MPTEDSQALVTVLIVNWNGEEYLRDCLSSVFATHYPAIEVIVVDNGSRDASCDIISTFPAVKLIRQETNIGFAAGNNVGFRVAKGVFVVTLNNDTVVDPAWLDAVVPVFLADERVGIVACRQMQFDDHERADTLYLKPSLEFTPAMVGFRKIFTASLLERRGGGLVFGASGASAVWRKTLIDAMNGFDENYFAYYEECDLCMRAFLADWRCVYVPSALVYHWGSATFKKVALFKRNLLMRNKIRFVWKFFPLFEILISLPVDFWAELRMLGGYIVHSRRPDLYFVSLADGLGSALKLYGRDRAGYVRSFKARRGMWWSFLFNGVLPMNIKTNSDIYKENT